MDNDFGHYNCTETGQRICLAGWKGYFCSEGKVTLTHPLTNETFEIKYWALLQKSDTTFSFG